MKQLKPSEILERLKATFQRIKTNGTILRNRAFLKDEAFLVAHADNLTIFEMQEFASRHVSRPDGTEMTMVLFETDSPQSCGIVGLDGQGVVQAFHAKVANPLGNLANAAVYIFEPSVVQLMILLGKDIVNLSTEVLPHYVGKVFAYQIAVYHQDIVTLKSWREANRDFPLMPALVQNRKAWEDVLGGSAGKLIGEIEKMSFRNE